MKSDIIETYNDSVLTRAITRPRKYICPRRIKRNNQENVQIVYIIEFV